MIETLYIEQDIVDHPRSRAIRERFPNARQIVCERYTEVFNPKAQNFRLQKQQPAMILAKKFKNLILQAPQGYSIGAAHNYYFSHMLNCLYDCRYCFLQGMFQSAHYVVFVNYEDFQHEIRKISTRLPETEIHFFSGYDCDSLALEPITQFTDSFLETFKKLPNAILELRTKSTQIRSLLDRSAIPNCIVAYSFTPEETAKALEHKAPPVSRRLDAMRKLQAHGWTLGLRFDPIIYQSDYKAQYRSLFDTIFSCIDIASVHSVSLGGFRLPEKFSRKMRKLYPSEKLFAGPLRTINGTTAYANELEDEMIEFCTGELLNYMPPSKLFRCTI